MAQSTVQPPSPQPQDQSASASAAPCRRIQVSREKRPLNFFVTLSKKFLTTDDLIELSGLGLAVTSVVTIAEILRTEGFVSIEHIQTSLVEPHPDGRATGPKAKIQIWIRKTPQFDVLMTNHNSNHSPYRPRTHNRTASPSSAPTPAHLEAGDTNPAKGTIPPDQPQDPTLDDNSPSTDKPETVPHPALQTTS